MADQHEAEIDQWGELYRIKANENAPHNFFDAVEILLNKPHVVNKRLCGKNILYRERHASIKSLSKEELSGVIGRMRDNWPLLNIHKVDSFIKEILPQDDTLREPVSKKTKTTFDNKSYSESNHRENIEVIVRELLPKRADIYNKVMELVILDYLMCKATFIPLANVCIACDKSTSITPNKEIAFCLQLQNLWLTAYVKERNTEIQSGGNENTPVKTLAFSKDYVKDKLIQQVFGWLSQKCLDVKEKSLTQINIERYNEVYNKLKTKYGNDLVKNWPMTTDPQKFVFEDIAIASYLLVLWEEERRLLSSDVKQTFVDLGCGNGLLVHLLSSEGHPGTGIDIRKRDIWNMYGENTNLQEMAITPSNSNLFPNCDWLIGNHSDELTPWIPIIAARSSFSCRFFVLPCCPWDLDRKFSEKGRGTSLYGRYLEFVKQLTELCGFCVKTDNLRIPSTKKACIIGYNRNYPPEDKDLIDSKIKDFIDQRCALPKAAQKCVEVEFASHSEGIPQRTATQDILCTDCDSEEHKTLNSATDSVASVTPCKKCEELREQFRKENWGSAKQGSWADTFETRNISEVPRNCSRIDLGVKNFCITTVTDALLATENMKQLEDGRMWNRGGQIKLSDVAAMFNKDILGHMKNECGGLQTLLKSSHHIFRVQKGCVELRDWSTADEVHFLAKRKKKGKKQQDMQRILADVPDPKDRACLRIPWTNSKAEPKLIQCE